jgi:hypothetical protein
MTDSRSPLDEALESWADARRGLIDEVQNIPAARMMVGELGRPDTNFRRALWPELLEQYASRAYAAETKADLVRLLGSQLEEGELRFREVGEPHMLQLIERFDGEKGTRLAWLYHGIDQEMYHRGQLVLYERMMGIEPALSRRIRGG